ncbi:MAG TPA: serine/threonine-protein kinase, partial [Kofleriaceae bacterium]|nr:serine/threonine-protein kinase [Kofleriaceae bacterium]
AAGIVHRDIKLDNIILVTENDDPDFAKILDFGIAKLLGRTEDEGVKLTQAGVAFGTPVYMSPEQAVGNPVDGRADLYCATVVLFEMITGRPPFYSEDRLEVLSMHTSRPPPALVEVAPEVPVPPEVEALVRRGLAKRPAERFADADEMIAALDAVLAGMPLPAPQPPRLAHAMPRRHQTAPVVYGFDSGPQRLAPTTALPTVRATQRRRRGLIAGLTLALAAVLALIVWQMTTGDREPEPEPPAAAAATAPGPADIAAAELRAGRPEAAIALLERAAEAANDAGAQLVLGHAYASTRRSRDALRAYERGLTLDPTVAGDATLVANLEVMLGDGSAAVAMDAADLLLGVHASEKAAARLTGIAAKGGSESIRHRAIELAEKRGLGDRIDRVSAYALDLEQGAHCGDRQKAVARLRALGERRAIPFLEKARMRKSPAPRWKGVNVNACLVADADAAIAFLQAEGR